MSKTLEIITPLGSDSVSLMNFSGYEVLGKLPEYRLKITTTWAGLTSSKLLGKNITVGVQMPNQKALRYFNGYITQLADAGSSIDPAWDKKTSDGRVYSYEATLRPWLWFLTRSSNSRIFQNKTVPQIIDRVFLNDKIKC